LKRLNLENRQQIHRLIPFSSGPAKASNLSLFPIMGGYLGNKKRISKQLAELIREKNLSIECFCEAFAGTGVLSKEFLESKIYLNDLEPCALMNLRGTFCFKPNNTDRIFDLLNNLEGESGIITKYYTPIGNRMFFTEENGKRIDAIRTRIKKPYYISALLKAADRIANVSAVYGAYLKTFKPSALKTLVLEEHEVFEMETQFFKMEARDFVKQCPFNSVLYLDPPYNNRQYGSNYFLPTLIAEYPETIEPAGLTGIPTTGYYKSPFCQKRKALEALTEVINNSISRCVCLSYNNEGIIPLEELQRLFEKFDNVRTHIIDFPRFKSNQNQENRRVEEYFIMGY